jgi:aspartate racemase
LLLDEEDMELVNHVIYRELCLGVVSQHSKKEFQRIIALLRDRGAEGVILGCTEIGDADPAGGQPAAVFDTAEIHAVKAALYAIGGMDMQKE